jgi:hypothetical protein
MPDCEEKTLFDFEPAKETIELVSSDEEQRRRKMREEFCEKYKLDERRFTCAKT